MFVQIDPCIPLVWRSHDSAQAGIDPVRVKFDDVDDLTARALSEMVKGTSTQRLRSMLGSERALDLYQQALPVLGHHEIPALPRIAVIGRTDAARKIAEACAPATDSTVWSASSNDMSPGGFDCVVLVSDFVVSPMDVQPWLGSDIDHLTVVFTESAAVVGPLVRPGYSACITCVELARIEDDPAWSAIAPQVWLRHATPSRALVTHAASEVLSVMSAGSGYSTRIDGTTLTRVMRPHAMHPQCGCRALPDIRE